MDLDFFGGEVDQDNFDLLQSESTRHHSLEFTDPLPPLDFLQPVATTDTAPDHSAQNVTLTTLQTGTDNQVKTNTPGNEIPLIAHVAATSTEQKK